jgi:hypothetical protein
MLSQQSVNKVYFGYTTSTPDGWTWASSVKDAIDMLSHNEVSQIYLEFDIGYDVLKWIENEVLTNAYEPPKMIIGKVDDVERKKMEKVVQNILRLYEAASAEYDDGYGEIGKMRDYD